MKTGDLLIADIGRGYIHRLDEVEIIGPSMRVDHEYWVKKVGCSRKIAYMSSELMTQEQSSGFELMLSYRDATIELTAQKYAFSNCYLHGHKDKQFTCTCNELEFAFLTAYDQSIEDQKVIIENLIDAIPAQTDDADWWPPELVNAVGEARMFLKKP